MLGVEEEEIGGDACDYLQLRELDISGNSLLMTALQPLGQLQQLKVHKL